MKIDLKLTDCFALVNLFHAHKAGVTVHDSGFFARYPFEHLPGEYQPPVMQDALVFSVFEVFHGYCVAAVWFPNCEVFGSDFAIIHVEDGKITKAQPAAAGATLYQIHIDDPDCADVIVSLGYSLYSKTQAPTADWYAKAGRTAVDSRPVKCDKTGTVYGIVA